MKVRILALAAVAAVAVVATLVGAACGGSDDSSSSGRATAISGVPDGALFVDQNNLKFNPSSLAAGAGETIYFKNSETALHTVTINGKNESGNMKKDVVFSWTPPRPGEYKVTCEFHPQMKATLTIE